MSDDEQGGSGGTAGRVRGSAPTFEYRVFLDGRGVAAVGEWEAEHGGDPEHMMFGDIDSDGRRYARCTDGDDLTWIATPNATDREAAVGAILKGARDADNERAKVVRAAHEAHVDLDFKVLSSSKIGEVPVHWKIVPSFSIGAKG